MHAVLRHYVTTTHFFATRLVQHTYNHVRKFVKGGNVNSGVLLDTVDLGNVE